MSGVTGLQMEGENKNYKFEDGVLLSRDNKHLLQYFSTGSTRSSYVAPRGVEVIGTCAFEGATKLQHCILPSTLVEIKEYAFFEATNIKHIVCYATKPPKCHAQVFEYAKGGEFASYAKLATLQVPASSIPNYKEDIIWFKFGKTEATTFEESIDRAELTTIAVYPNPATDHIQITGVMTNVPVIMTTINGQIVYKGQISANDSLSIDVRDMDNIHPTHWKR